MSTTTLSQNAAKPQASSKSARAGLVLQRTCACGGSASSSLAGECEACKKKRLQKKLSIGASNDPLEAEADRVSDQVMATSPNGGASSVPLRIQRITGQANGEAGTAPASVDRVLAGSGKPLDPALQKNMGQRFGYDFSGVRIHTGAEAERSARDVNAHAYTVGRNIVFGAGRFAPETRIGQRLIAHELTHVLQQGDGNPCRIQRTGPSVEERVEILPGQLRSGVRSVMGDVDDMPQPRGTPRTRSRYVCGPEVGAEVRRVWTKIQTDFRGSGWSASGRRNACLYLVQLFTPQTPGGQYAPPTSTLPVSLNKNGFDTLGLFQVGAGWQRRTPYHPPCGVPGTAAPRGADDRDPRHEDPGRCSNTVTIGGQCWLMGTVNYGAFGVMMKLCHDLLPATEGAFIGEQFFASIERYIGQIQRSRQTIGSDVGAVIRLVVHELLSQLGSNVPEAASAADEAIQYLLDSPALVRRLGTAGATGEIARDLVDRAIAALLRSGALRRAGSAIGGALGPARLFSRASLISFVAGYKVFDADDPGPPLRWALATYDGGPGATPSGGNRPRCHTTCRLTYHGRRFDYVWEPTKPRRAWP